MGRKKNQERTEPVSQEEQRLRMELLERARQSQKELAHMAPSNAWAQIRKRLK